MKKFMFTSLKRTSDRRIDATCTYSLGSLVNNIFGSLLSVRAVVVGVMLLGAVGVGMAATITITTNKNWSEINPQPTIADNITIANDAQLTINVGNAVCNSITIGTSGKSGSLTFTSSAQVTVSTNITSSGNKANSISMANGGILICQGLILSNTNISWIPGIGTVNIASTSTLPPSIFTSFNNLTISSGITTLGTNITVSGNLTVAPTAGITVPAGITLTNNGTFTLQSNTNGTATLINTGTISGAGQFKAEQFITGANNGIAPNGRYWYMSSPVAGATSNIFDAAATLNKLWYYSEPDHAYAPEINDNTTALNIGVGYVVRLGADATVTFTGGSFNTGNQSFPLSRTGTTHAKRGYNLIGNPYPSHLDWEAANKTNLLSTMWYRSYKSTNNTYVFDTYNATAHLGINNSGNGAITQYIPPMQAFWVKVNPEGVTNGSFVVNNTMRSHQSGNKLRSAEVTNQQVLRLQVSNGTNTDETIIVFNTNALDEYDDYDSPKMTNDLAQIPEVYTFAGSEQVAINGMNHIEPGKEITMGFKTGESTNFTIKATQVINFDNDTKILLVDKLLNKTQSIKDGSTYSFSSASTNTSARFAIVFNQTAMNSDNTSEDRGIHIYQNNSGLITVSIGENSSSKGIITVSSALGRQILSTRTTGENTVINTHLKPGVYLVSVTVTGKQITQKVIID